MMGRTRHDVTSRFARKRARRGAWPPRRWPCRGRDGSLCVELLEERALLAVQPLPIPFSPVGPAGSLIYASSSTADIEADDTDSFTAEVDAGQTLSVVVTTDVTLQARVELLDPSNSAIATATASASGESVVLNTLATTSSGTYTVNVEGESGTIGDYSVKVLLNAAVELEPHGGAGNDSLGSAQDLDMSFLNLGAGSAQRGAVIGSLDESEARDLGSTLNRTGNEPPPALLADGKNDPDLSATDLTRNFPRRGEGVKEAGELDDAMAAQDWYRFTLQDGQSANLSATVLSGSNLHVELFDAAGNRLSTTVGAPRSDAVIGEFFDRTSDDSPTAYFIAVAGEATDYSLIVTSIAVFEREPNNNVNLAEQDITRNGTALGALSGSSPGQNVRMGLIQDTLPWQSHSNRSIAEELSFTVTPIPSADLGTIALAEFDIVVLAGNQRIEAYNNVVSNMRVIEDYVESGGLWITSLAAGNIEAPYRFDLLPGANDVAFTTQITSDIDVLDPTSPLITGPGGTIDSRNLDGVRRLVHGLNASSLPSEATPILSTDDPTQVVAFEYPAGRGRVIAHTIPVEYHDGGPHPVGQVFHRNLFSFASLEPDSSDFFVTEANAGDSLVIETWIPAEGPGEFVNELEVTAELYDPAGALVASSSEGALSHQATSTGTFTVRLTNEKESSGEYVLNVSGQTGDLASLAVTSSNPADSEPVADAPGKFVLGLSDQALLTSVDAADLMVDGQPATGLDILPDGRLAFGMPPLTEGPHTISVSAGAWEGLQGQPVEAFTSTFEIDKVGPRITNVSVQEGDVLPAGKPTTVSVGFDERIAASGLDRADVLLQGDRTGVVLPTSLDLGADSSTVTLDFAQLPEDHYTLTLTSGDDAFEDVVGNDMDGEALIRPIPPRASGDGKPGGDFVVSFTTDITTAPYHADFEPAQPFGSLVYDATAEGEIGFAGDVDRFTVDVDDDQTITIVVQSDEDLQGAVELIDPNDRKIAGATASAAGQAAVIRTIGPTVAGTYTVAVSGKHSTIGTYAVSLVFNAAVELEKYGSVDNDTLAAAQDIDDSFIPLGFPSAERGAVISTVTGIDDSPLSGVNTPQNEQNPSMTADGLMVVFNSGRPGGPGGNDIFIATRATADEPFGNIVPLSGEVNTVTSEGAPFISADGLTLLFHGIRLGGHGGNDLYQATRASIDEPFGNVVNLGAGVNSNADERDAFLSADGLMLLFSSNRAGTFGSNDIYLATRASKDEPFGNVEHLGPGVNSSSNDKAPTLSPNGLRLLFQSNRPRGLGGHDIYEARRSTPLEEFAQSQNLGPGINTRWNERSPEFSPDGATILYASNRNGGQGLGDLYQATRTPDWYRFTLQDGQSATVTLHASGDSAAGPTELITYQHDREGYSGTVDTFVRQADPDSGASGNVSLNVDGETPAGTGQPAQALLRFEDIFGDGPGRVHADDQIVAARLELIVTDQGHPISLHRMLQDWSDQATWNSLGGDGIQADGSEAVTETELVTDDVKLGVLLIDVTSTVRNWQKDPSTNHGWALLPTGPNGVDIDSSEGSNPPRLIVQRRKPPFAASLVLTDDEGKLLAEGHAGADNHDLVIHHFVDPTDDGAPQTYFVRTNSYQTQYGMVVTRDADFEVEHNNAPALLSRNITATGVVMGSVTGISQTEPLRLAVMGDWGDLNPRADDVANMIKNTNWDVDLVATVGDNNYEDITPGNPVWESVLGYRFGDFMLGRSDNRYPLQTSDTQRFFPSIGNHDVGNHNRIDGYLDYFHMDPSGQGRLPAGVHTVDGSYYDVEIPMDGGGSMHLFVVDSVHALVDDKSMAAQQRWLENELRASTATWKFVMFHHAPYSSSSSHGSNSSMQWDFAEWGADAVFSGHDHTYERIFRPDERLLYFVNGLGGRSIYGFGFPIRGSQFGYNNSYGAMRVTVDLHSATFEFYSVEDGDFGNQGGARVDSYTVARQKTADQDFFRVDAVDGDVVFATARTPGDGSRAITNELDAELQIHAPGGTALSADLSEGVWHTVEEPGTYSIGVVPNSGTSGEYVLHVDVGPVGDMDGNNRMDTDDASTLGLALRNPASYETAYGKPPSVRGDADGDGDLDFDDIDEFVSLLMTANRARSVAAEAIEHRPSSTSDGVVRSPFARVWPLPGGHDVNPPSPAEQVGTSAAASSTESVPASARRQLDTPEASPPATNFTSGVVRALAALRRGAAWPGTEKLEAAVWTEDSDWLLTGAEATVAENVDPPRY